MQLVSIICVAYNQVQYIKQCLEGFLNQKTNFEIEILIHDDASTDGTKEVIEEYVKKYPNIIKPFFETENQYLHGKLVDIVVNLYKNCKGKYIAQCDADDYWCDEYKLQKQFDFMEANPDYVLCYHPAKVIYENQNIKPSILNQTFEKNPQPFEKLLLENYIPANSAFFRAEILKKELNSYPRDIFTIDYFTNISISLHGKIGYLPDVMYVYRRNSNGISFLNSEDELYIKYGIQQVNFTEKIWLKVKDKYPFYYNIIFIPTLRKAYLTYLKNLKFDKIKILTDTYASFFKDIDLDLDLKFKELTSEINIYKNKYHKYKKLLKITLITLIILSTLVFLGVLYVK